MEAHFADEFPNLGSDCGGGDGRISDDHVMEGSLIQTPRMILAISVGQLDQLPPGGLGQFAGRDRDNLVLDLDEQGAILPQVVLGRVGKSSGHLVQRFLGFLGVLQGTQTVLPGPTAHQHLKRVQPFDVHFAGNLMLLRLPIQFDRLDSLGFQGRHPQDVVVDLLQFPAGGAGQAFGAGRQHENLELAQKLEKTFRVAFPNLAQNPVSTTAQILSHLGQKAAPLSSATPGNASLG